MDSNGSGRLRAMEAAFQREKQQRDLLEKKYARLKRRYVRLERSHNRLLTESQGKRSDAGQTSPQPGTPRSVESTPNTRTPFSVIDLTSPRVDFSSTMRIHNESRNLQRSPPSFLSRDEICAESPNSSVGSPDVSTREFRAIEDQEEKEDTTDSWLPNTDTVYSSPAPRRRLHLDFTLPTMQIMHYQAHSSIDCIGINQPVHTVLHTQKTPQQLTVENLVLGLAHVSVCIHIHRNEQQPALMDTNWSRNSSRAHIIMTDTTGHLIHPRSLLQWCLLRWYRQSVRHCRLQPLYHLDQELKAMKKLQLHWRATYSNKRTLRLMKSTKPNYFASL
ncbi:hypothetical protein PHMEG_00027025, partial [Phytophthora megakarya]